MDGCRIILVELCPCDTKDELLKREAHYIQTSDCVNIHVPDRKPKEYYEGKKEQIDCIQNTIIQNIRKSDKSMQNNIMKHI